jgi:hypothetical protein
MKLVLISFITPAKENIRGTSALPYHLLVDRNKNKSYGDINLEIFSFNNNQLSDKEIKNVELGLNAQIHVLTQPFWLKITTLLHIISFVKLFLKFPLTNYIKLQSRQVDIIRSLEPDIIFIYGEELSRVVNQFKEKKVVHLGPDSEALYYYRMLGQRFVFTNTSSYIKNAIMYLKYLRLENRYISSPNIRYHVVGEEDANFIINNNPQADVHFLRHPHYEMSSKKEKIHFHHPKIKLLIAGQYNLYMKQSADEALEMFCQNENLSLHYDITFLGKGWDSWVERLKKDYRYFVEHIKFAPNYIQEICKHDIQLTPITIGTGTKGKVLDALANGLLVIGTKYALENIAVYNGTSCLEYKTAHELYQILTDIPTNFDKYEQIAAFGRESVITHHNKLVLFEELIGQ